MENVEYLKVQMALMDMWVKILQLDLEAFLRDIDRAQAIAPITDPTMYRSGAEALDRVRTLAEAAHKFKVDTHGLWEGK